MIDIVWLMMLFTMATTMQFLHKYNKQMLPLHSCMMTVCANIHTQHIYKYFPYCLVFLTDFTLGWISENELVPFVNQIFYRVDTLSVGQ